MQAALVPPALAPLLQARAPQTAGVEPCLFAVRRALPTPRSTAAHRHGRGQLFGVDRGLLSVQAAHHRWVVPASDAVWIPPDAVHAAQSHGAFSGWSVYVAAGHCAGLPERPCVLPLSPLLKAAVARAATWPSGPGSPRDERVAAVILDEIAAHPDAPGGLPLPLDARARRIADALAADPADNRRADAWAAWAGLSPRTLRRRFTEETGFGFEAWRLRLRLLRASEWLAEGRTVTAIAMDLGYGDVSAFIARFRTVFGVTPGRYARERLGDSGNLAVRPGGATADCLPGCSDPSRHVTGPADEENAAWPGLRPLR